MSDPASVLARLIEFGSAPAPEPSWPWVWTLAYEAVSAVHGSRAERWTKFEETIYSQPDFFTLRGQVMAAVPIRENRERQNRFIYSAAAPEPFSAQVHFSGDQFHFTLSNEKPISKIPAAVRQNTATAILDLLAESPADTQFLVANLPGISLGTIRNVLHQLKLSGLVERADGGSMGAKATYRLSVKGLELLTETRSAGSNHDDDLRLLPSGNIR